MVTPQVCRTEAEIRRFIAEHLPELMAEKQEVMMVLRGARFPIVCIIKGYEPPEPKGEYADTLFVNPSGSDVVYITTPGEVMHFEVLSTYQMTPELGYKQMKEMERGIPSN